MSIPDETVEKATFEHARVFWTESHGSEVGTIQRLARNDSKNPVLQKRMRAALESVLPALVGKDEDEKVARKIAQRIERWVAPQVRNGLAGVVQFIDGVPQETISFEEWVTLLVGRALSAARHQGEGEVMRIPDEEREHRLIEAMRERGFPEPAPVLPALVGTGEAVVQEALGAANLMHTQANEEMVRFIIAAALAALANGDADKLAREIADREYPIAASSGPARHREARCKESYDALVADISLAITAARHQGETVMREAAALACEQRGREYNLDPENLDPLADAVCRGCAKAVRALPTRPSQGED